MAGVQYQCKICGEIHEAPRASGGTMYLRCIATHEWAWYEPASFVALAVPAGPALTARRGRSAGSNGRRGKVRARAQAPSSGRRRVAAARSSRGKGGRTARASRKRR